MNDERNRKASEDGLGHARVEEEVRHQNIAVSSSSSSSAVAGTKRKASSAAFDPDHNAQRRVFSRDEWSDQRPQAGGRDRDDLDRLVRDASLPVNTVEDAPDARSRRLADATVRMVLPAGKVFPIQVGDKLFRLSGASISSDAPSYFSDFFESQTVDGGDEVKTLYIDRDPITFDDIVRHLQGYHVQPRDGQHFVRLFADAQFFSLPRLMKQLFSTTHFIRIGDTEFQIPRDLFNGPGDSPNYFTLGISVFLTSPHDSFPGISQNSLLRPPSILPPAVPNRSAKTFAELLHFLKGYPIDVQNDVHRAELIKDAQYYHLKGLEQRLVQHHISYNLARKRSEILLKVEDVRPSGISLPGDPDPPRSSHADPAHPPSSVSGWVHYQRPYVDRDAHLLIVETGGSALESCYLSIHPSSHAALGRSARAVFFDHTLRHLTTLFAAVASQTAVPITHPAGLIKLQDREDETPSTLGPIKACIGPDADVTLNGQAWTGVPAQALVEGEPKGVANSDLDLAGEDWIVKRAQWRVRIAPSPETGIYLSAVKIEAYNSEKFRNQERGFLAR